MSSPIYLWRTEAKILQAAGIDAFEKEEKFDLFFKFTGDLTMLRQKANCIESEVNTTYAASTANKIYWFFGAYDIGERTKLTSDLNSLIKRIGFRKDRPSGPYGLTRTAQDRPEMYTGDYSKAKQCT